MMERPSVFIETSIIGFLASRRSRSIHTASKQIRTHDWWRDERNQFDLFVSEAVIAELAAGDETAASERLGYTQGLDMLAAIPVVDQLAQAIMEDSGLPPNAHVDAIHMATAAVHGMDDLLTRNCKHIANAAMRPEIVRICLEAGFPAA
ncbi:MAG: type II toxin-antitoxin system VapC family toxin [Phycisphaerales bacterium]